MDPLLISNATHPEGQPLEAAGKPEPASPMEPLQLNDVVQQNYPDLLDHTLGVIFSCINNLRTEPFQLSSNQLNWASKFIDGHQVAGQSPDLKHLSNYLQQISIALNTEELFHTSNDTHSGDNATESTEESNSIYDQTLDTLQTWRSVQLASLDRDYDALLAIEKLLLDLDFEDDQ